MKSLWLAILTAALLLAPTVATAQTPDPDGSDDGDVGEVSVTITAIEPAILRPGDDLVVRGSVTNGTASELTDPEIRLRAQQQTPISRSMLERWLDPQTWSVTELLHVESMSEPLDAGAERAFSIRVPSEDLPLEEGYLSWGPRGIEVAVGDALDPIVAVATDRSYLLWWPDLDIETMPLAVVGAVTPTAEERRTAESTDVSVAQAAEPRLGSLLEALDRPTVDIAFDPSLLYPQEQPASEDADADDTADDTADDAAGGDAEEPEPDPTATEVEAAGLPDRLVTFTERPDHMLYALPWADADVAALAHLGRTDLLTDGAQLTEQALAAAGLADDVRTDLAWPAAAEPDAETVGAAAATGSQAAILSSSALAVLEELTYTPSGRTDLAGEDWQLPAALLDDRLSAFLTGEHLPYLAPPEAQAEPLDPLTARQLLLAETAVISRERPTDRRDLVLAVPRDFDGSSSELAERLDVLDEAPWLDRVPLEEVLGHEPPADLERTALPDRVVEPGEVTAGELDRAQAVLDQTTAFAGVLDEPQSIVEPVRAGLLTLPAVAWRQDTMARVATLEDAEAHSASRRGLVAAQPGSTLNLINAEAHIPVAVSNSLTEEAHVEVVLRPRDPRLMAPDPVALSVPAQETTTAQVPVQAIGSGNVVVDVLLTSPQGETINDPTEIQVRVRADWETVGTAVVAGLLGIMLVAGVVRTVLRVRRERHRPTHARDGGRGHSGRGQSGHGSGAGT